MKKIIFLFLVFNQIGKSQVPNLLWSNKIQTENETCRSSLIKTDKNNNVVIVGTMLGVVDFDQSSNIYNLTANTFSFFIVKYNNNGALIWAKILPYSYENLNITEIELDDFGNLYLTGTTKGIVDFDPSENNFNINSNDTDSFILKLDINGNLSWVKTQIIPGEDMCYSLDLDSFGNIYSVSFPYNTFNYISINKFNQDGTLLWNKYLLTGPNSYTTSYKIAIDINNNNEIVLAGNFNGELNFDLDQTEFKLYSLNQFAGFICKYGQNGNLIFAKKSNQFDELRINKAGSIYANTFLIDRGYAIIKYDKLGNSIWESVIGNFNKFALDHTNSDILLFGNNNTDSFLAKLDSNGNFLGSKIFGVENEVHFTTDLETNSNGDVYAFGFSNKNFPTIVNNLRQANFQNKLTLFKFGKESSPLPLKLVSFVGIVFNSQNLLKWSTSFEENNAFFNVEKSFDGKKWQKIGKIQSKGNHNETKNYEFIDNDLGIIGNYYRIKIVSINEEIEYSKIIFIQNNNDNLVKIYPNPVKEKLTIENIENIEKVEIIDILGQKRPIFLNENKREISTNDLPNGVYFLKIYHSKKVIVRKFLVEK
jgi:hypothetical protein